MTEKQEKILQAAMELFATEGYHATSTNKVAKQAHVSEGLIFRHYGNKEGLLKAVIEDGKAKFKLMFANIVMEDDPKKVIKKTLLLPFEVKESDYEFWKLQFKLKWEFEEYDNSKIEPLENALINAFKKLGEERPELETEIILHLMDGIGSAILKNNIKDKELIKKYLLKKYNV